MVISNLASIMEENLRKEKYFSIRKRKSASKTMPIGGGRMADHLVKWEDFSDKVMKFWASVEGTLRDVRVDSSTYPVIGYHYSRSDGLRDESEVRGACRRTIFDCVNKTAKSLKLNATINAASSSSVTHSAVDYATFVLKEQKQRSQSEEESEKESKEESEKENSEEKTSDEASEDEKDEGLQDEDDEEVAVLIPIEIKGIWQFMLERGRHLCDVFDIGGRERLKVIKALSQIYYYMVVEEVEYGILTSKEQHVLFWRTADPSDKTLYVSKTFEGKDKTPTVRQCYLYMLWKAKNGDAVSVSQVPITQPSQKWVLLKNIVTFDQVFKESETRGRRDRTIRESRMQGGTSRGRHRTTGREEAIMEDDNLGQDVAIKWLSCLVETRLESLHLGKVVKRGNTCIVRFGVIDGVHVVVKMFEFFETMKCLPHFKTEIETYERLSSLQGQIIPKLVRFGTVWSGGVGFIAAKREGRNLKNLKGIDPLSMKKLVAALGLIHQHGILHNDIHLENIVYSEPSNRLHTFKIVDFGNSILFPHSSDLEKERANFISLLRKDVERLHKRRRY